MKKKSVGRRKNAALSLESGQHAALLYTEPNVVSSALGWLAGGIAAGEACAVMSYDGMIERTSAQLRDLFGVDTKRTLASGQLAFFGPDESHKKLLSRVSKLAVESGKARQRMRLLTCFGWGDAGWPDEDELLHLDSKLNALCTQHKVAALCLYDARQHAGSTLLNGAFECHPLVFCRNQHRQNPFYVAPAVLQKELRGRRADNDRLSAWMS